MACVGLAGGVRILCVGTYPVILKAANGNEPGPRSSLGEATSTAEAPAGHGCAMTKASATCGASFRSSGTLAG